jgi:hypothetical protein
MPPSGGGFPCGLAALVRSHLLGSGLATLQPTGSPQGDGMWVLLGPATGRTSGFLVGDLAHDTRGKLPQTWPPPTVFDQDGFHTFCNSFA